MSTETSSQNSASAVRKSNGRSLSFGLPIVVGLGSWLFITLGFLGLKMLMQERPQFTGQPLRFSKTELVQDSPQVLMRKLSDDISVVQSLQPESAEVSFDLSGRRDYRGLRTIIDMSGVLQARYLLTNAFAEPIFLLFKCPHPRPASGPSQALLASGLQLQSSVPGMQEQTETAWLWSGEIAAHAAVTIDLAYRVSSLKAVTYRVPENGGNAFHRLRIAVQRQDLAAMVFESGDGVIPAEGDTVVWERKDFLAPDFFSARIVNPRNLYASLAHLLEIGPLVCLLFLVAVAAVILARQPLTVVQVLTISAGFALYFPLILYLSSRFSFAWALIVAVMVPGALLVNYARWLLGAKIGLLGSMAFLALYQVFPTLASFAGWNRGMVLLVLGVVTLWVLIHLQNQALKQKAATVAVASVLLWGNPAQAGPVQLIVPGEWAAALFPTNRPAEPALLSWEPAAYVVRQEATYFAVELTAPFQVVRAGALPAPLFHQAVHYQEEQLDGPAAAVQLLTLTNGLHLLAIQPGPGTLRLKYRAPIEFHEGKYQAQVPLLIGASGTVLLESGQTDLEIRQGHLWAQSKQEQTTQYRIGVAGEDALTIAWRAGEGAAAGAALADQSGQAFYGIGITRAQNLTVVNSDGSCRLFAEFEVPVVPAKEFVLKLPPQARLISVLVNGREIDAPAIEEQRCRLRLPDHEPRQTSHHLSFRLAYPQVRLGFIGKLELSLPEVFQTVGRLEWVVALPVGFETQVISSGLVTRNGAPDLERFGDYGRILETHPHTYCLKDLAPPGRVTLQLKYRQIVPGFSAVNRIKGASD